jgi:pimeloyl-ACP methyl ester carboxylesterase
MVAKDSLVPTSAPVGDGDVVINGTRTRYWVWGDVDASTTILAVHGFRGDHHGLLPVVAGLTGYRVITPDLPGFGESAPFDGQAVHDVAGYARWLADFAAAIGLGRSAGPGHRWLLLGHSFGSVVSAAAVADGLTPDRLVLINPIAAPALQGPRAVMSRVAVAYYRVGAALPERLGQPLLASRAVVRLVSQLMVTTDDPGLRNWIHDQHRRYFSGYADRRVVLESFTASVSHHVGEYADLITVPTLLIAGDRDDLAPVPAQRLLAEMIKDSRLEVITGVGHLIHYEQPTAAAELIMEFHDQGSISEQ